MQLGNAYACMQYIRLFMPVFMRTCMYSCTDALDMCSTNSGTHFELCTYATWFTYIRACMRTHVHAKTHRICRCNYRLLCVCALYTHVHVQHIHTSAHIHAHVVILYMHRHLGYLDAIPVAPPQHLEPVLQVSIYVFGYACMYMHTCRCMYVCMHVCMYIRVYILSYVCILS
jgi:hypothetical protein